jgi:sarcosine oxidase, subunit gamma
MGEQARRESPLARFDLARRASAPRRGGGVIARERASLAHLNLRGDPSDAGFVAAVGSVLGTGLPVVANTVHEADAATVFWLGPDEWLIVTSGEGRAEAARRLHAALGELHAAVTDVSGGQTAMVLRGPAVRDVLAKGCPLDLHPRAFGPGRCAQSHLAKAPVLLRTVNGGPATDGGTTSANASVFELVFRRSFADYVWTWLEDAAAEYGLEVEA